MSKVKFDVIESVDGAHVITVSTIASLPSTIADLDAKLTDDIEAVQTEISESLNKYEVKTADFQADASGVYWLASTLTATLPVVTGLPLGSAVKFSKAQAATPVIQTADAETINVGDKADTSLLFDLNAEITFVFNGTNWEV